MSNQGVFSVAKVRGDARLGEDDDGDPIQGDTKKIVPDNSYMEKLRQRLASGGLPGPAPTAEGNKDIQIPTYVIYGDDGHPVKP